MDFMGDGFTALKMSFCENFPCSRGNTSSLVDFPARHVSFSGGIHVEFRRWSKNKIASWKTLGNFVYFCSAFERLPNGLNCLWCWVTLARFEAWSKKWSIEVELWRPVFLALLYIRHHQAPPPRGGHPWCFKNAGCAAFSSAEVWSP